MEEPTVEIVRQGIIESEYDLTDLHIIDWCRLGSYWRHAGDAIRAISSWFIWRAMYTGVKGDLCQAPDRDDWPGWKHVGRHEQLGRLYWNYFHWVEMGTLSFHDEPDFSGTLDLENEGQRRQAKFWGDIGKVSAVTFAHVQKQMNKHDLWISIPAYDCQVIIEAADDIQALWMKKLTGGLHYG